MSNEHGDGNGDLTDGRISFDRNSVTGLLVLIGLLGGSGSGLWTAVTAGEADEVQNVHIRTLQTQVTELKGVVATLRTDHQTDIQRIDDRHPPQELITELADHETRIRELERGR